jgi:glycosyltransferase involved in cell wall biosynthesis
MKVLHISLFDRYGGACIAAHRQHTALRQAGVDSQMWVRFKVTNDPYVHAFTPTPKPVIRAKRVFTRYFLHHQHKRSIKRGEFFDDRSEHGGNELSGMPVADVVNVQFAWNFIHYPSLLQSIPATVPVVFTMHEMAPFTGGCSYAGSCIRFEQQCGHCPLMAGSRENDLSRQAWRRKQSAYSIRSPRKIHFAANSHWLADKARKSGLLAGLSINVIHLGLDMKIYRPMNRTFAREVFNVPPDMPVVSFAAAAVSDERKGVKHLIEALRLLPQKPFLLTWGRSFPPTLKDIPHKHLGNIDDEHFMALAYNAADVFVMPSLEEAFGQTALEAIACGTPVTAFAAGGIPDIIRHEQTGLLAAVGNSQELSRVIARILSEPELWNRLSFEGRKWATEEFSLELNAKRYAELYDSLLKGCG